MFDPKQCDEIARKLFAALPSSLQTIEKDIQEQFKEILQSAFAHLDIITREEFDVQSKVLARTRDKLDHMQNQIESLINQNSKTK
jgi:ubiquinone biosynthesis accessory factor UbiK